MALNNPAVTAKQTFVLVSGNSSEPDDGLFFQEMSEIIKVELATRGMYEAPSAAAADVTVRVETRVEGPFIRLIETSVAHESTPRDSSLGTGSGHAVRYTDKTLATYYNKVLLTLTAMENPLPSEGLPTLVWKVEAAAEQKKTNLREILPTLVATAASYIGEETQGEISIPPRTASRIVKHVPNRSRFISR